MTDSSSSTPQVAQPALKTPSSPEDVQKMRALTDEFLDRNHRYLKDADAVLDKLLKVHESGASFYEKLILFDVGTIALSLTLLGQIVVHATAGHIPRHPFEWYLCPAWVLLLLSIYCCAHRITGVHNVNVRLTLQMSSLLSQHHSHEVTTLLNRISSLTGAIFSNINKALVDAVEQEARKVNELIKESADTDKKTAVAARLAMLCTTAALLLICIFTIKSLLAL